MRSRSMPDEMAGLEAVMFQHENLHLLLSLRSLDNLFCMGPAPEARLLTTCRSHRPPGCFAKISLLQVNTIKSIGWGGAQNAGDQIVIKAAIEI